MKNEYIEAIEIIKKTFNCSTEEAEQAIEESLRMTHRPNAKEMGESLKKVLELID